MSTLMKQYQRHCHEYMRQHSVKRLDLRLVAEWMLDTGRWKPEKAALIRQCHDRLADALRQECFTDPQGRKVRAMHPIVEETAGKQTTLWEPLREIPRKRAAVAVQQNRQRIVADCRKLKIVVDSYNENYNDGKSIQLSLDFTKDILEDEFARANRKTSSSVPKQPSSQSADVVRRSASSRVSSRP